MKEPNSDDRLFGILAVILLSVALLGPWIIAAFSKEEAALGFGAVGVLLAFVFGIIGWRHRAGKVTVCATGALLALSLVMWLVFAVVLVPKKRGAMQAERAKMDQVVREKQAETQRRDAEQIAAPLPTEGVPSVGR
jgi:hypothetical protein